MLSVSYIDARWSFYQPILTKHRQAADLCAIDVTGFPLRTAGPDAREYIPYAVDTHTRTVMATAVHRLYEYMQRYVLEGVKVSAHKLPPAGDETHALIRNLRKANPHLPPHLLHHWCADPKGGMALQHTLSGLWRQALKQELAERNPWLAAINILCLRLLREAIVRLPEEGVEATDEIMKRVLGGLYAWALQAFIQSHLTGTAASMAKTTAEVLMLPVTAMAFLRRQVPETLLPDAGHVIAAYGLEPDLIPRLRACNSDQDSRVLADLAQERMAEHLLKRSWARLSLADLAEKSGQGAWLHLAQDGKRLDRLLSMPEQLEPAFQQALASLHSHPFAEWLLARIREGRKAVRLRPWLRDFVTLRAYRVFAADVEIEIGRRRAEERWLDLRPDLVGDRRGEEADRALSHAHRGGKIVLLQRDTGQSLRSKGRSSSRQACLRMDWLTYLADMEGLLGRGMEGFLKQHFLPRTMEILEGEEEIHVDEFGAGTCLLRGPVPVLLRAGMRMYRQLLDWFAEYGDPSACPPIPVCVSLDGPWYVASAHSNRFGECRLAYASGLVLAKLAASRKEPLQASGLDNNRRDFVITGRALAEIKAASPASLKTLENEGGATGKEMESYLLRDEAGGEAPSLRLTFDGSFRFGDEQEKVYVVEISRPETGTVPSEWAAQT